MTKQQAKDGMITRQHNDTNTRRHKFYKKKQARRNKNNTTNITKYGTKHRTNTDSNRVPSKL